VSGAPHDAYAALRHRDFRLFFIARVLAGIGGQAQIVAVGWELYERTRSSFALGLVGLVSGVPVIALALPAGHAADRFERRRIVTISGLIVALTSLALAAISQWHGPVALIYAALFIAGLGSAFNDPARISLLPQLVPRERFANAVTWNSTGFLTAAASGPALGGVIIAWTHSATPVYVVNFVLLLIFVALIAGIRGKQAAWSGERMTLESLAAGLRFVRQTGVIFAAITLDLFAVLLGGATTLLPVFAKDILHVGPSGLGWLRAAPSVGALVMAIALTHRRPMRKTGHKLMLAVSGFGVATIVFGLSRSFALSLALLALLGALDAISMVIRSTLVQTRTPDVMRGRVSAVNSVFVDTSNELGGFESGVTAAIFGPVISVVAGGIGTLVVVAAVARKWPELARLDALHTERPA